MTRENDNRWKAIAISAIWVSVAVASLKMGFFALGLGFLAFFATLSITEA